MNKYTDAQKQDIINRYVTRESVTNIVADSQIPPSTVYSWIIENPNSNISKKKVARLERVIKAL